LESQGRWVDLPWAVARGPRAEYTDPGVISDRLPVTVLFQILRFPKAASCPRTDCMPIGPAGSPNYKRRWPHMIGAIPNICVLTVIGGGPGPFRHYFRDNQPIIIITIQFRERISSREVPAGLLARWHRIGVAREPAMWPSVYWPGLPLTIQFLMTCFERHAGQRFSISVIIDRCHKKRLMLWCFFTAPDGLFRGPRCQFEQRKTWLRLHKMAAGNSTSSTYHPSCRAMRMFLEERRRFKEAW
jgi:hypothetical protein